MSDVIYRANLKAAGWPFLTEFFGRSIIVKQSDQTAPIGTITAGTIDNTNQGTPQIFYCQDVLPTDNGYCSVGYNSVVPKGKMSGAVKTVTIHDSTGQSVELAITTAGALYYLLTDEQIWHDVGTPPPQVDIANKRMTAGTVNGVPYIYFAGYGCYTLDFATGLMTASPLVPGTAGFTQADILGICSNRGYLIAYSGDSLYWSSTTDALDFDPSLVTGAGGGQIESIRGVVVTVENVYGGFIVFSNKNCVSAVATNNSRFPYNFQEIPGAGGVINADFVSYDANSSAVYAYTTAGLQQIQLKGATVVFPEVTDFLSGNSFETFSYTTNLFTTVTAAGAVILKRLCMIANRYLVISYGIGAFTHALVYDTAYKQWGKLKVDHVYCFDFVRVSVENAKKSMAFLTSLGEILIVNSDIEFLDTKGVMLLGKYQYVRTRLIQLQRVAFENVKVGSNFQLYDLPTLDGKNFLPAIIGFAHIQTGAFSEYLFHNTALNHTLLLKGGFNATSLVLTFNVTGAR